MLTESALRENFKTNLNNLLVIHDKKQIDLANGLGISKATINDWCKGRKIPRLDKIRKIAEYFHIEPNELLSSHQIPEYKSDYLTLIEKFSQLDNKGQQAVMGLINTLLGE